MRSGRVLRWSTCQIVAFGHPNRLGSSWRASEATGTGRRLHLRELLRRIRGHGGLLDFNDPWPARCALLGFVLRGPAVGRFEVDVVLLARLRPRVVQLQLRPLALSRLLPPCEAQMLVAVGRAIEVPQRSRRLKGRDVQVERLRPVTVLRKALVRHLHNELSARGVLHGNVDVEEAFPVLRRPLGPALGPGGRARSAS